MSYYLADPLFDAPEYDPGVALWKEAPRVYPLQLVDRSGRMQSPYQLAIHKPMPDMSWRVLSFSECCESRAYELIRKSNATGLPLAVMWSGGIDSTVALVSLIRHLATPEQLIVLMDRNSVAENSEFFTRFVKGKFRIESFEPLSEVMKPDRMVVTGELGDQLFGFDIARVPRQNHTFFKMLHMPHSPQLGVGWLLAMGMTMPAAMKWYAAAADSAAHAPCPVVTMFDLLWWINFAWKWQYVYFRMLMRQTVPNAGALMLAGHLQHFYDTDDFQRWSIATPGELKVGDTWSSYKRIAKDVIHEFDNNDLYRDHKIKLPSGMAMNRGTPYAAAAIDTDMNLVASFNIDELYQADHSFL